VITPGAIPQVTGDLDACYSHGFMVSVLGSRFADTGSAVMRSWSGLSGVYVAPESGVLLAAMVPVAFTAGGVGADLNTAGSAIMSYATAVRPIKARLQGLASEASVFVAYASAHGDWNTDQSRVDQHNAMLTEVNDLMARWEAAERSCANTIDALYGGTQYGVNNGDGTASANEYGLTADQWGSVATGNDGVPWGTAAGRDKPWYEDVGDAVGGVFVGVWHGVTGLVTGFGGFVGFQGWDVMGQSWKGLGALAIVAASPQVMFSNQGFLGYQPGEIQATVTGMGKGLIAYDRWASDPAQAAGESVFNIATFFIPVGGAAAGAAKAASLAGKTAQVVGVAGKAAKVGAVVKASRVADVVAGVRTTLDLRLNNAANALHTALGGPDRALAGPGRSLHLPEAPVPHTPDLHATTIHPGAPAHPTIGADGAPAHPTTGHDGGSPVHSEATGSPHSSPPASQHDVHDSNYASDNPRTSFSRQEGLQPNTAYHVDGRGTFYTDSTGHVVYVEARGGTGRLNIDLQHPVPNATYHVNDHAFYHTDDMGRATHVHIDQWINESGVRSPSVQTTVGGLGGPGYDGGHLVAVSNGGIPENINITPMIEHINRGAGESYSGLERILRNHAGGVSPKQVSVDVYQRFDGKSMVPQRFVVRYTIDGIEQPKAVFLNE